MAVFRVEKNANYTTMSNYHFKERCMSLKAKGLLSLMLSLPDKWDYSMAGLVAICKESETAIKSTLDELKTFGYLSMTKRQNDKGHFVWDYNIFETPTQESEPYPQNPCMDNPAMENVAQVNTKQSSIKKELINKKVIKVETPSGDCDAHNSFEDDLNLCFPTVEKKGNVFADIVKEHGKSDADWALSIVSKHIDEHYPSVMGHKHPELNKAQRMGFARKFLDFVNLFELCEQTPASILRSIWHDDNIPDPTILIATDPKVLGYHALKIGCVDYQSLRDTEYCPVEDYY